MKLDLRVRDLKTGDTKNQPFASFDEAKSWLAARPRFTEVLGVASHNVAREISNELKDANRPLDDEETKLRDALEASVVKAEQLRRDEQARVQAAAAEAEQAALATADPNRPVDLRYTFNGGLMVVTPGDQRPISDEAREAVMAWIAERDEWVESRGQVVGDANLRVWPGPIPDGEERIVSGTFIPVSGPAKS